MPSHVRCRVAWPALLVAWLAVWLVASEAQAGSAGKTAADSLRTALHHATTDSARARLMLQLTQVYFPTNSDSVLAWARRAQQLARRTHQPVWEAKAWGMMSAGYHQQRKYEQAFAFRQRELVLWRRLGNRDKEHKTLRQLGAVEYARSNYAQALEYMLPALRYFEQTQKMPELLYSYNDVYSVYMEMDDRYKTRPYFNRWLQLFEKHPPQGANLLYDYCNTINYYNWAGDYQRALVYARKAEKAYKGPHLTDDKAHLYLRLAETYVCLKQPQQALPYATAGLAISEQLGLKGNIIEFQIELAQCWSALGEHARSLALIKQVARQVEAWNETKMMRIATYEIGAKVAEDAKEYRQALAYTHRYQGLRDSLFNLQHQQRQKAAETRHENYRREQEAAAQRHKLAELRSQHRITQLYLAVTALGLLVLTVAAVLLVRQRRLRAERDNAELRAQQAELLAQQLQAHETLRQTQHALDLKAGELAGLALKVNHKEQLMEDVKEELSAVAQTSDGAARTRLRKLQQSIAVSAQAGPNWDYFQQVLEQVHPRFFMALQRHYPDLTHNERRMAALLRLNLTTKDMAAVMSISDDGVKKARYRLRRKLGLNSEDSLTAFIFSLDDADDSAA